MCYRVSDLIAISPFTFEDEKNAVLALSSVGKEGYRPVYFTQFRSLYKMRSRQNRNRQHRTIQTRHLRVRGRAGWVLA